MNAARLIGAPWRQRATGPDAFDCWGLVRFYFRERFDLAMPEVDVYDPSEANARAIVDVYKSCGWRPSKGPLADGDIVLVWSLLGQRHVGVMHEADGELGMLHCEGTPTDPRPGVVWEPIEAVLQRYLHPTLWRRIDER